MSGVAENVNTPPVEQGSFYVGISLDQFSAEYISRLINGTGDLVAAFNGKKFQSLGISWLDAIEHEEKHGIDTYFLPYFEEIDGLLNSKKSVVDVNSWSAMQLPAVNKVFFIDNVFFLIRNGIAVVDELNRNLSDDDKRALYESVVLPVWLTQNRKANDFNSLSDFEKLCFLWDSNGFIQDLLAKQFSEKNVKSFRFDSIVNDPKKGQEFLAFINDEQEIVFSPEQEVDNEKIIQTIWLRWSEQEKSVFLNTCSEQMSIFGFYIPGFETAKENVTQNIVANVPSQFDPNNLPEVHVDDLHKELGFSEIAKAKESSLNKSFKTWKMEDDDSPIFRYLYRNFKPDRHLEFGTWQGTGVTYVTEECDASVWTLNLFEGEKKTGGDNAYGVTGDKELDVWADFIGIKVDKKGFHHTDAFGYIGNKYLSRDYGHRVCQIYADSKKWDISKYPEGFFDSVLIDGGHYSDVVMNDTLKALKLVRSGGLILWHDVCPEMYEQFDYVHSVMDGIKSVWSEVSPQLQKVFWVRPSFILVGIKK